MRMGFSFGVNVYAFIPMVLFYNQKLLKIVKNGYTWEWVRSFYLRLKNLARRAAKYTALIKIHNSSIN